MRRFVLSLSVALSIAGFCRQQPVAPKERPMRATLRHIEAGGIGYNTGYTSLDLFLGHHVGNYFPFFDLRAHYFNDGKWAANGGFGARFLPDSWDTVFGFNLYYDYRRAYQTNFQQGGAGIEFLRNEWEARVNGYLPFWKKSSGYYDPEFAFFRGNQIFLKAKKHVAMAGGDAEFGYNFLTTTKNFSLFLGAGPYFYHPVCGSNAIGGRFRATAKWKEYISVDLIETYDNVFHNNTQGQISFTLPFGPKSHISGRGRPSRLGRRMMQSVVRDEIIVLSKCKQHPVAVDPSTGDPYFVFFVDNQSHSEGTFASPFNALVDAQDASSPNDIIYVFPGDGTITGLNAGISLQDNQQLLGASTSHPLQTTLGAITIPALRSGFPPIIGSSSGAVVTLANNNTVSGFYIQYLNTPGITNGTTPITGLTATQNIFQEVSGHTAIDLSGANVSGNVLIADSRFNADDISINIASDGVNHSGYSLLNNIFSSSADVPVVQLNYTDCSGIVTNLSGNTFLGGPNTCLAISVSNTSAPGSESQFTLTNNSFYSSLANAGITLSNVSNTSFAITSNDWLSPIQALSCIVNDSASTNIAFSQNNANNASMSTPSDACIFVSGDTTGSVVFNASDNTVYSNNQAIALGAYNAPFHFTSANFDRNTILASYETIAIFYTTTQGPISIQNNSCTTYINDPNVNGGAGAGILVISSEGGNTPITIANNYSSSNNYGICVNLNSADTGTVVISENNALSQDQSPGIYFTTRGATPLTVSNNTITSRGGGIGLGLNNSITTPITSSITGNAIQSTGGQNALDITVSSLDADAFVVIENNTGVSLLNQGIALHSTGSASYTVLNNTFQSSQQALFLQTNDSGTCSIDAEQNNLISIESNTSEFQSTSGAPFNATFKNNRYTMNTNSSYSVAEIFVNYSGNTANVSILDNTFIGNDTQVDIVAATGSTMNATISNNLFSISGNANAAPALSLTSMNDASASWKVQGNAFESFANSAASVTAQNTSTACLTFTDNLAQPIPNAYSFTSTSSMPFTLAPLTGNVGEVVSTSGTTPGTCP